ncbi:MAG TPA: DUF72 domain-containing protein [Pseudonocardiaceae bacterium]|jgi:uncharacterized protein YecE (DUF72 family)
MWTHASWPGTQAGKDRLRAYASWCNAVEGNTTFYATPSVDTVRSWAAQTAPDFRFLLKLPKLVTHERRFVEVTEPMRAFLAAIEPLGPRIHALWTQLPPTFAPSDLGALTAFLRRMPKQYRSAVEVRHRAFFEEPRCAQALERVLGEFDAEWVSFDTTVLFSDAPTSDMEREAWQRKPRLSRRTTALTDHPIVRYIGRDDVTETVEGWQPWLDVVVDWLHEGRSPTVFLHTPDNVDALTLARTFHDAVRAKVSELEPLPQPLPVEPLSLF